MNCLQHETSCVSVYRSMRWNIYHNEGTDRMTLNMFLHVVAEFETTVTQNKMLCNLPGMDVHVYCLVIPDAPPEYVIHQESSLPVKCLQQGQNLLTIPGLPLPIPSTRNHLILLHGVFNMATMLLGNDGPPLTIPSTSNHNFLCKAPLTGPGLC